MAPEMIKEYLGNLYDLERESFLLERLRNSFSKKISSMGCPQEIDPPKKTESGFGIDYIIESFQELVGLAFIGMIIGGLIGVITKISFFHGLLYGSIIGALSAIVLIIISSFEDVSERKATYERECLNYQRVLEVDAQRVKREQAALVYLQREYAKVESGCNQTRLALNKLYGLNILFVKYHHNFAAISSLYEYFCAGRFKTLEEAYNQLELEIRLDRICLKLDEIIRRLDEIRDNQYMIYNAINQANSKLNSLLLSCNKMEARVEQIQAQGNELINQVASLQTTSDLNLYINALNNRELSYMRRWMAY